MAGQAHAVAVGALGDGRHPGRVDRAVELDADVALTGEAVDVFQRLSLAADRVAVGVWPNLVDHRSGVGGGADHGAGIV